MHVPVSPSLAAVGYTLVKRTVLFTQVINGAAQPVASGPAANKHVVNDFKRFKAIGRYAHAL